MSAEFQMPGQMGDPAANAQQQTNQNQGKFDFSRFFSKPFFTGGFQIKQPTDGTIINSAESPNDCKMFVGGISRNTNTGGFFHYIVIAPK